MDHFFEIRTNAPVDQVFAVKTGEGTYETLDPADTYRCDIRKNKGDPDPPILRFETGSVTAPITVFQDPDDGVWCFRFRTAADNDAMNELLAGLEPGMYVADMLKTNAPDFEGEFTPIVKKGVTTPPWL